MALDLRVPHTVERLRGEFTQRPGLRLTPTQVQRLCGIDDVTSRGVLDALVDVGFLRALRDGAYARADDHEPLRRLEFHQPAGPRHNGRSHDVGAPLTRTPDAAVRWPIHAVTALVRAGYADVPMLLSGGTPATRMRAALEIDQIRGGDGPFVIAHPSHLAAISAPASVYLEAIGEWSAAAQHDVARWLGSPMYSPARTRLISATGNRLFDAVSAGRFDQQLFYRLSTIHIALPDEGS